MRKDMQPVLCSTTRYLNEDAIAVPAKCELPSERNPR